jgi:hypothetical protein
MFHSRITLKICDFKMIEDVISYTHQNNPSFFQFIEVAEGFVKESEKSSTSSMILISNPSEIKPITSFTTQSLLDTSDVSKTSSLQQVTSDSSTSIKVISKSEMIPAQVLYFLFLLIKIGFKHFNHQNSFSK